MPSETFFRIGRREAIMQPIIRVNSSLKRTEAEGGVRTRPVELERLEFVGNRSDGCNREMGQVSSCPHI